MQVTPHGQCNNRFPARESALSGSNRPRAAELKGGLFFWLNDRIATIRLANAIIIMNVSKTVIQQRIRVSPILVEILPRPHLHQSLIRGTVFLGT